MKPQVGLQDYPRALQGALTALDLEAIAAAAAILFEALQNGRSIALTGPDGMRPHWFGNFQFKAAQLEIRVQADDVRVIEDAHLAICHMLAGEIRDRIARSQETPRAADRGP